MSSIECMYSSLCFDLNVSKNVFFFFQKRLQKYNTQPFPLSMKTVDRTAVDNCRYDDVWYKIALNSETIIANIPFILLRV